MTPNYMFINTSVQNRNELSMKASILDLALSFINGVASVGQVTEPDDKQPAK